MNQTAVDQFCERAILGCVLAVLIFGPLAFGAVDRGPFLVIQVLTAIVLLLWCARLWSNPKLRFLWPPMSWAVLGFVVYAIIRYFNADIEYVARQELIRVLIYAALFLAVVNNLHGQDATRIISLALIFLAMAIAATTARIATTLVDMRPVLRVLCGPARPARPARLISACASEARRPTE